MTKKRLADLTPDADTMLDAILLGFKEKLPSAGMDDTTFLKAARTLLEHDFVRIMAERDGSMWLAVRGEHY